MKKIVYLLFLPILFATSASAQNFSMQQDTVKATVPVYTDVYNYINNITSGPVDVNWRIISETLPQSWKDYGKFGLCDNVTCYDTSVLRGATKITDTISAGKKTMFKVQFDGSNSAVTPGGPYYITAEVSDLSFTDTVTFELYKWPANVPKVTNTVTKEEITLYPNPAYNEVNVTFNKEAGVKTIAIYNLLGKQVAAYRNTNNSSAKLDIDKIPSGIYFVRLMDGSGHTIATRRFTHQ